MPAEPENRPTSPENADPDHERVENEQVDDANQLNEALNNHPSIQRALAGAGSTVDRVVVDELIFHFHKLLRWGSGREHLLRQENEGLVMRIANLEARNELLNRRLNVGVAPADEEQSDEVPAENLSNGND
ncbi:unnamed protein product [Caenorhabditis sp. 36 PRJEB53466]|nr:unnamed protein product [Caenorhabditis sp. 36 PRJEB53466]